MQQPLSLKKLREQGASDYVVTPSQNIICRSAVLHGSQQILMAGHSVLHGMALLRGDLAKIQIGRLVIVNESASIKPPQQKSKKEGRYVNVPVAIGHHVLIGSQADVNAAAIGNWVEIGDGVSVGERCILHDNCKILPPDTNVPQYSVFGGAPATFKGELHESWSFIMRRKCEGLYRSLQAATTSS